MGCDYPESDHVHHNCQCRIVLDDHLLRNFACGFNDNTQAPDDIPPARRDKQRCHPSLNDALKSFALWIQRI